MKKLILFELNEVPFRVIDKYVAEKPNSCLAKVLGSARVFECHNEDTVQLDPWIAWPTLHRGVVDETHGIFHLGQHTGDADKRFPPIWQLAKANGKSVGVFGSLTSSSVPTDADSYSFYIPDYFAYKPFANPPSLLPFQKFNLTLTRESGRNVSSRIPLRPALSFARTAALMGVSFNTIKQIVRQLAGELVEKRRKARRRSIQPLLMLDLFLRQMEETRPVLATFYTNHVAAAMHRYWAAYFPEDFPSGKGMPGEWVSAYCREIPEAMDRLDEMLQKLVSFVEQDRDYKLVIATALGQAAIPTDAADTFATVLDAKRLLSLCGIESVDQLEMLPAMVPCISASLPVADVPRIRSALSTVQIDGERMIEDRRPLAPLSFEANESGTVHIFMQWDNYAGSSKVSILGREYSFAEAGLGLMVHEDGVNCSAQHVKNGALIVYGGKSEGTYRQSISSIEVAPSILNHIGVSIPSYMHHSTNIFA